MALPEKLESICEEDICLKVKDPEIGFVLIAYSKMSNATESQKGPAEMSDDKPDKAAGEPTSKLLADLCREAVALHGSDWPAIEKYVASHLQNMRADEQVRLMREAQNILRFEAPMRRPNSTH